MNYGRLARLRIRLEGFEPSRYYPRDPKSHLSANSNIAVLSVARELPFIFLPLGAYCFAAFTIQLDSAPLKVCREPQQIEILA